MHYPPILKKPALTVVGLEAPFIHALSPAANNLQVIGALWDTFTHRIREVGHRVGHAMFGVLYDRPIEARTHPDELLYLAGVAVSNAEQVPEGMIARTIPAGTFAVFIHRGPINKIAETAASIYRTWLPQSGYQHARTADVEMYDDRFCVDGEDSEMEYWIPVAPKAR